MSRFWWSVVVMKSVLILALAFLAFRVFRKTNATNDALHLKKRRQQIEEIHDANFKQILTFSYSFSPFIFVVMTCYCWIGKFRIPDDPGTSTIARLMGVNFFAKTNTNVGNLPLSLWKTIETLKRVRFQCLNFTSKPKGYLLQTTKMWEKLIVLKRRRKKATKAKEEVNFLSLKRAKFVKMTIV